MKSLFFGLLLINLGVYAWFVAGPGQIRGQYAGVELPTPPAGVASLRLLDEQTDEAAEPSLSSQAGPSVAFFDPYCFTVGPIPAKSTLREVRDLLASQGIKAEARREGYEEFSGNWIYLPPTKSRAEARQLVALLTEKGIKDHLIVPSGPKRNAVSLGFFRNVTAAGDYLKRLQALGFAPVMEENYRSGLRYWLDFSTAEATPLSDTMIRNLDSQYEVGISRNACGESGQAGG